MPRITAIIVAATAVAAWSCGEAEPCPPSADTSPAASGRGSTEGANVLAKVNGVAITEEDVRLKLKRNSHESTMTQRRAENLLGVLIQEELVRQRAVEIGLDDDPGYRARLRPVEAQLRAFEREQLGDAFFMREIADKAEVDEAAARWHFEKNAERYRSEFHVLQIMHKGDEARAKQDLAALEGGTPFAEVARRKYPDLPPTAGEPWDLGFLGWPQLPEPWRARIVEMQPGQTSGVIAGPGKRFWIIKLIETRENPEVRFETHKAGIVESLKAEAVEALRAKTVDELKGRAEVVITGNRIALDEE